MRNRWLPLLFAAGAAKRIGFGPLRENEYPAAKWMQAHTTAAAELVPASVQVDFTKGERCVLAHEGVTLRRAAQLAVADGCMAGDELCGNQAVSGAPDNSSLSHASAMTRPCWLCRAARNRHPHAIEQASRRW